MYLNMKKALACASAFFLKTDPNFNTNAPPFEVRGCIFDLGGAKRDLMGEILDLYTLLTL